MSLLSSVPQDAQDALMRHLHRAAYDAYEQYGPLLEGNLGEFADDVFRRIQPELEEYVRAGIFARSGRTW